MAQGLLPFQFEEDPRDSGITGLAGLPLYLDMAHAIGLRDTIRQLLETRTRGWTDAQLVMSILLLNIAGGDRVDDLDVLEKDDGFVRLLGRVEDANLTRQQRRAKAQRWKRQSKRGIPSQSAMFRFLKAFHDPEQEELRKRSKRKAFIPAPNEHLQALAKVNAHVVAAAQRKEKAEIATLDVDATLIHTKKEQALYCYEGGKAYQPLNVWWAQLEMMVFTEYRDGNVPAGFDLLRVFKKSLEYLPAGIRTVRLRSDTAGYEHKLLKYLIKGHRKRCGRSEDAHSVLKTDLASGTMPSKRFGANAAWWWLSNIAMNLNTLVKRFALGGDWVDRRLKALRFGIIKLPGIVVEHARRMIVRTAKGHPAFRLILEARARIAQLMPVPAG